MISGEEVNRNWTNNVMQVRNSGVSVKKRRRKELVGRYSLLIRPRIRGWSMAKFHTPEMDKPIDRLPQVDTR